MTNHSENIAKAEARGLRVVEQIVREWWLCRFQEFEARNDDGIDGIIIFKKNSVVTGEIVQCQIKSGKSYKRQFDNYIGIKLGAKYINKHRPKWDNIVEPVILIYVEEPLNKTTMPRAWWVNLKSKFSFSDTSKSLLLIPNSQRFADHSIGEIKKLCGTRHLDHKLQQIILNRTDVSIFNLKDNLKIQARTYYINWANKIKTPPEDRTNPKLGEISISRVGWKHLTRKERKTERIIQSFHLLGAAKRIIMEVTQPEPFGHPSYKSEDGIGVFMDYIGLRAFVIFPHRYESAITVVLRRRRMVNEKNGMEVERKYWFYTVYESRRGRDKKNGQQKKKATDS